MNDDQASNYFNWPTCTCFNSDELNQCHWKKILSRYFICYSHDKMLEIFLPQGKIETRHLFGKRHFVHPDSLKKAPFLTLVLFSTIITLTGSQLFDLFYHLCRRTNRLWYSFLTQDSKSCLVWVREIQLSWLYNSMDIGRKFQPTF